MSRNQPSTVGTVIKRLRRMLGHVGKQDREAVLEAIEAITELSTRLFDATHVEKKPSAGLVEIRREPLDAVATDGAKVSL